MFVHGARKHGCNSTGERLHAAKQTRCTSLTFWWSGLCNGNPDSGNRERIDHGLGEPNTKHEIRHGHEAIRSHIQRTKR